MPGNDTAERFRGKLEELFERHSETGRVRIHRSISWLGRSQSEGGDPDTRFILLWIAFNAAFASEFGYEESQHGQLRDFVARLVGLDATKRLHDCLFRQFSGPIRTLIENRFVYEPFWRAMREHDSSDRWESQFATSKQRATKAMIEGDTVTVLAVVFDRLYVLRNQLVHGGATWNSKVNRAQVRDGANLLGTLVPIMIDLMLDHPEADFGNIAYPVLPSA